MLREYTRCVFLIPIILVAIGCASSGRSVSEPEGPSAPRHRCYEIEDSGTCEADAECEVTHVHEGEGRDLVFQCAPGH